MSLQTESSVILQKQKLHLLGLEKDLNCLKESIMFYMLCNHQAQSYTINYNPYVTCIPDTSAVQNESSLH